MKPQMMNSYEFRLIQVSSYSGQTVGFGAPQHFTKDKIIPETAAKFNT